MVVVVATNGCRSNEPGSATQEVTFRTEDGFLLEGTIFGSGDKGVVLAHMFPADQSSWFEFARRLVDSKGGFTVLSFNFRGYGASQGDKDISVIDRDVRAAVRFLKDRKASRVALVGASMGGTACVIAAATAPVDAIVTLSAPVEFMGLDASTHLISVAAPKLFIAAKDDREAAEAAGLLHRGSAPPRDIHIAVGSGHGTDLLEGSKGDEIAAIVIEFVTRELAG